MAENTNDVDYRDDSPLTDDDITQINNVDRANMDQVAFTVANWLRQKMYGVDVREALAQWTLVTARIADYIFTDTDSFKEDVNSTRLKLSTRADLVEERESQIEKRQSGLEDNFHDVIGNETKDSEVIIARDSSNFGRFKDLGSRIGYIETMLVKYVPQGFNISIKHNQGRNPSIKVVYYEYSLGTEPNGLGAGPDGSFGGTNRTFVTSKVDYPDMSNCVIHLPLNYALNGSVTYHDGYWFIIDGYKVLKIDMGAVSDKDALAGNDYNTVSKDSAPADILNPTASSLTPK